MVLFGGLIGPAFPGHGEADLYGDTWEWDGSRWVERTPAHSPEARRGHGMAYDAARGEVVLHGGYFGCCSRFDTWVWDGTDWALALADSRSFPRHNIVMDYDDDLERVVFFGGRWEGPFAATLFFDDVMAWDGSRWTAHIPSVRPFERSDYGLAYDSARDELVLFGGTAGSGQTWIYGIPETGCDDADDNGNGLVDEGCDDDLDGWCDPNMPVAGLPAICSQGPGDCDDGDSSVHPGAPDLPGDRVDQDCDGAAVCSPRDAWRSHGEFVRCVSMECGRLVSDGAASPAECSRIVRDAARASTGRRSSRLGAQPAGALPAVRPDLRSRDADTPREPPGRD